MHFSSLALSFASLAILATTASATITTTTAALSSQNLLQRGDFDNFCPSTTQWCVGSTPTTIFPWYTVDCSRVHVPSQSPCTDGQYEGDPTTFAADGSLVVAADLNPNGPGGLAQKVTIPGGTTQLGLTFDLTRNPYCDASGTSPLTAVLTYLKSTSSVINSLTKPYIGNNTWQTIFFNSTVPSESAQVEVAFISGTDTKPSPVIVALTQDSTVLYSETYYGYNSWQTFTVSITAKSAAFFSTAPQVELSFISNTASSCGPVITNVALFATTSTPVVPLACSTNLPTTGLTQMRFILFVHVYVPLLVPKHAVPFRKRLHLGRMPTPMSAKHAFRSCFRVCLWLRY
ncbi:hypothetical protein HDU98_010078 [Podochytrium sp. JEL0797]|nr:hypothetical protein HDU98_010078 [Podochytrium sp. JEL0797]